MGILQDSITTCWVILARPSLCIRTPRIMLLYLFLQPELLPTFFLTFINLEFGVLGKHLLVYHIVELKI